MGRACAGESVRRALSPVLCGLASETTPLTRCASLQVVGDDLRGAPEVFNLLLQRRPDSSCPRARAK